MRKLLSAIAALGACASLCGCFTDTQPRLAEGFGLYFQDEGSDVKLAYGLANSDDIALMLECAKGTGEIQVTDVARDSDENINTAVDPTNTEIETLLSEQYARAAQLLQENRSVFMSVARGLLDHGEVSRQQFAEWLGLPIPATGSGVMEPYANRLTAFESQLKVIDRLVEPTLTEGVELVGADSSANLLTRWG